MSLSRKYNPKENLKLIIRKMAVYLSFGEKYERIIF